jgi:threonine/homoserine/homoserine lactone efflux protein
MLAVLAFVFTMAITPGPNNLMVTAAAANFGFARTVPHMLGVSLGFPVMLILLGLGPGLALVAYPPAHHVLKLLGALYLLYLAWQIATASGLPGGDGGRPLSFIQAALFQWLNPKAWVIALGALTAYTTVGGPVMLETLVIAAVFVPICFASLALWAGGGMAVRRVLRSPRAIRAFNLAMALLLVLSLVPLFL